ncbi:MAG: PhnD/SsuA/transferrin family substrate-binding protein [Spirochaetales bacterium]|nr:PhnD/SsuA/transferrin family substrate-binding protein [Spirochaetales bacterium]
MKKVIILVFIVLSSFVIFGQNVNRTVRIGILAKRGIERSHEQWDPTAEYLSSKIEGYNFTILPLNFNEVYEAVEKKDIDFIFANSSYYVGLAKKWGVSRIVTLKNLRLKKGYIEFGGVIFTLAERDDITDLNDIKGLSFAAVDKNSFGGWQMAYREFHDKNIDPFKDFSSFVFAGTHDAVVMQVLSGKVDAGTVRTDTIERMDLEGKIDRTKLKVLAEKSTDNGSFPFSLSTRLYPEWPIAKLEHTDRILAEKVSSALIAMDPGDPAAIAGVCEGWTIPSRYGPVDNTLQVLQIFPYENFGTVTLTQILEQYSNWIIIITVSIIIIIISSIYITKLNYNLQSAIIKSNKELSRREVAEKELLSIQNNLERLIGNRTEELLNKNIQLEKTLETNTSLIREVHHRVKNNLQIIISLMNMQQNIPGINSGRNFCLNMQRRISSISLVHELLFSSEYLESLSTKKLLDLMSYRICEISNYGANEIRVNQDSNDEQITLDIAIPLGLIISEVIANSLQYAKREKAVCTTTVSLFRNNGSMTLTIEDNGIGFPENFIPEESGGLGLQLVGVLVEQIHGKVNYYNKNGAVTEIIFPIS